jgi:hypothetical protein
MDDHTNPTPVSRKAHEALVQAHCTTITALNGCCDMLEGGKTEHQTFADALRTVHARHADILARHLVDQGSRANRDGTFGPPFQPAANHGQTRDHVRHAEDHVLTAYAKAAKAAPSSQVSADLNEMTHELTALLQTLRSTH